MGAQAGDAVRLLRQLGRVSRDARERAALQAGAAALTEVKRLREFARAVREANDLDDEVEALDGIYRAIEALDLGTAQGEDSG